MHSCLLLFPDYLDPGHRLAEVLDLPAFEVALHQFPDGESRVTLPPTLPPRVLLVRSLDRPNDKLIELLLCAETARGMGVRELWLVAPYLCYMRQDIAFHPGEAVSQRIIGDLLAGLFDGVLTIDPHLHRIDTLQQAIDTHYAYSPSAAEGIGRHLAAEFDQPLLVGPDCESERWVSRAAAAAGLAFVIAQKVRHGDREVEIELPDADYQGRCVVLVDDMISTGHTLITLSRLLYAAGAREVHAMVTHMLGDAAVCEALALAGIRSLSSSDTLSHPTNRLSTAGLLAGCLEAVVRNAPSA